ncbi:MAG: hypothetical protein AAFP78_12115 [Pseudomonadota bacterium]
MTAPAEDGTSDAPAAAGDAAHSSTRPRDAALLLPLAGLILFTPPLLGLFTVDVGVLGAPLIVCYVFAVWALLIFGSRKLARSLDASGSPPGGDGEE